MVVLEVFVQTLWKLEFIDRVVRYAATDYSTAEMLQRKAESPTKRQSEHRFKEHATIGIFVVLNQTTHGVRSKNA